jgi:hypothetical protein
MAAGFFHWRKTRGEHVYTAHPLRGPTYVLTGVQGVGWQVVAGNEVLARRAATLASAKQRAEEHYHAARLRPNPMPPVLAEMRLGVAAARKALANGQREKARSLAQAAIDAARGARGDAKLRAKLAELDEAARYVMAHAAPRPNPFAVGDRVADDYGRRGIVHRKLPQNSYDVAWVGYGGRALRAKEEALQRVNPMGSYRGYPYTATAGVYRLRTPHGPVTFSQSRGGMAALRAYVDERLA